MPYRSHVNQEFIWLAGCVVVAVASWIGYGYPFSVPLLWVTGSSGPLAPYVGHPRAYYHIGLLLPFGLLLLGGLLCALRLRGRLPRRWFYAGSMFLVLLATGSAAAFYPQTSFHIVRLRPRYKGDLVEVAEGFSQRAFVRVRRGDTREAVAAALGRGFQEIDWRPIPYDGPYWQYTRDEKLGWRFRVCFSDDRVDRLEQYFVID